MSAPAESGIAALNDAMRQRGPFVTHADRWAMTEGVVMRGSGFILAVLTAVKRFDAFTEDNDPYGEHDFGAITVNGEEIFWKIDCYDLDLEYGSPDPSDPDQTRRVLTVMLASEY